MNWRLAVLGLLAATVMVSAVATVYAKHHSRTLFVELSRLSDERDTMNIEWGRLQLEQSTWATHGRIEQVARERLGMVLPEPGETEIVFR
ncbi:MAG: cell division protein FtsL [Chromatiales bacterium]|jgi:cell division protein FtsL